jgi:hypothetical protein
MCIQKYCLLHYNMVDQDEDRAVLNCRVNTFWIIPVVDVIVCLFVFVAVRPNYGPRPPRSRSFLITHNDAPQSVGLLCTSDQLVAETST